MLHLEIRTINFWRGLATVSLTTALGLAALALIGLPSPAHAQIVDRQMFRADKIAFNDMVEDARAYLDERECFKYARTRRQLVQLKDMWGREVTHLSPNAVMYRAVVAEWHREEKILKSLPLPEHCVKPLRKKADEILPPPPKHPKTKTTSGAGAAAHGGHYVPIAPPPPKHPVPTLKLDSNTGDPYQSAVDAGGKDWLSEDATNAMLRASDDTLSLVAAAGRAYSRGDCKKYEEILKTLNEIMRSDQALGASKMRSPDQRAKSAAKAAREKQILDGMPKRCIRKAKAEQRHDKVSLNSGRGSEAGLSPPPKDYFGASAGLSSGTFGIDYAHLSPSQGDDADQWGFRASGLFPFAHNFGLDIDAGYHKVSSEFFDLDNWTAGASLVWQVDKFRLGPSFGFQSNSVNTFTMNTYNYGGFVDYFATPHLTLSAKTGGFSSDPGGNGYYIGGQIKGYLTPNLALSGAIDHTHFNAFQGSDENDYGLDAEYLFWDDEDCWWPPTSFYVSYDHTTFSPGSFDIDTVGFGIKLYTDGNGATTLRDRQRTGVLTRQTFSPLRLRF
jgi:hypothetical protein